MDTPLRPPVLRAGDTVRLVSPSGPADAARVARGVELLTDWGLTVEVGAHAYDRVGYLAGTDADRLADLHAALVDPSVRGVFCTRGGYGAQRVVDRLDPAAVRADPKVVVGFSDATALHLALWRTAGLATLYGPGAAWLDVRTPESSAESLRRAVLTTGPVTIAADPAESTYAVRAAGRTAADRTAGRGAARTAADPTAGRGAARTAADPTAGRGAARTAAGPTASGPTAAGTLLGGNLCLLAASAGTPDLPDTRGAILLLEDVAEPPYKVDRMLTQLHRAGALHGLAGVAVGQFTDCVNDGSVALVDVLAERLGALGVPVLGGLPIGHGVGQLTVPLGVPAVLDVDAGTLIAEAAVTED